MICEDLRQNFKLSQKQHLTPGWLQSSLGHPPLGEKYTCIFSFFHAAVYSFYINEFE